MQKVVKLFKNKFYSSFFSWVLAFEIFIPLVLFFILLGLRQKKPAIPVKEAFYSAAPLTSAGIIPVMQSLCPDGQRDEFGFLQYKNSTVTQLLERIGEVVEQNHLFMSDRPSLGEELESLQQHLESLSSAQSPLENRFNSSFTVGSVLRNQSVFQQFLIRNLSLANDTASLLLSSPINLKEVRLLTPLQSPVLSGPGILLTGAVLEMLTCGEDGNSELNKILLVPEKQQSLLQAYQTAMCGGEAEQRAEHFREISEELRDQIDTQRVIEKLRLEQANASVLPVQTHLGALLKDLAEVERLLRDVDLLSGLAKLLPKGACAGHQAPPSASNATWSSNSTTSGPNTTDGGVDGGAEGSAGKEAEPENPHSQFSAFVQLWAGLQPILCGNNRIIEPEALKQGNMSSLGFTSKEQRNLGLLVHLMTTNPKILYSPIGSQVDKVIQKANETFAFVGNVTHYAKVWLNISAELRAFLEEGKLHNHLAWLQQFASDLRKHPELLNSSDSELVDSLLQENFTLPNISTLLEQLDTIDNAACVWLFVCTIYCPKIYSDKQYYWMYGLPRPWYFPLQKSYWLGSGRIETWEWPWGSSARLSVMEEDQACAMEHRRSEETRGIEEEPSHLPLVVCIDKLTKVYKTGRKLALNKLSLNLHENQVVSFLGHNGAGKTTTMSILTGLFPPTSGSATIYGHDIRTEMERIRQNLGMCPQHNVLFDKLSVEEHLWFYSRLKGMAEEDIRKEMDKMIEDLELSNKRHSLVQTLSGGMKRKLSVAIAFVGGSRAVILDEPTAGVDPYARRAIWDLILKYKQGRTILLSTHHMDEADLLGDRIAIISHGKLKCCGSPLFLKSTYGDGYKLTLVKKQSDSNASSVAPSSSMSPCSESRVTQFIRQYVASCLLVSDSNTELSYVLPSEAVKKGCFERLFQALEQSLESLALTSFGVMDTTLEEVFLKVSEEDLSMENSDAVSGSDTALSNLVMCSRLSPSQASLRSDSSLGSVRGDEGGPYSDFYGEYCPLFNNNQDPDSASLREPVVLEGQGSFKLEGWWLKLRQFHGLIVKRFHCAKRNTKGLFSQILLPAFFVCVAMTVALSVPEIGDLPPLILSPSQYHNYTQPRGNFIPYANEDRLQYRSKLSPDANPQKIVNTLRLPSGVGATCVLKTPFNSTLDQLAQTLNPYANNSKTLAARYFDSMCLDSFTQGVPLSNFVPPPPSPAPSDDPEHFEDGLWNYTATPPTTVHEMVTSPPPLPLSIHEPVRCICSMQGTGFSCPSGVGGRPPLMKVVTGDILVDITGRNVSEYLLYTSDRLRLHRYGGLTVGNIQKSVPASFGRKTPPMVRKIAVRRSAQVLYNNKGYHSMPTYLNVLNNAILRANMPLSKGNPAAYGITVTNHPMNRTSASLSLDYLLQGTDVVIAIFIIVAMSFVPASFVVFLVAEKSTKAKHLQFVSGCDPVIYWLANYIWDMLNYLVPATCCILILFVFDLPAYTSPKNFPAVLSLFLLYGWSITPIMYPASFWFEVPSTAYVFLIVINLFIGITATVATFLLQLFEHDKDLKLVNSYLKSCFLIFPNYNLGHGLMEMAYNEYINEYYAKIGQFDKVKSPFEWDIVTRGLVAMTIEGFVGFLITILCQYNFLRKPQRMPVNSQPIEDDDVDVSRERRRVLRGDAENDMLKIENLTKVYKSRKMGRILAVDRLCLGVRPGECFGLLGVNGAGKTTTFKMLTGDESTTGGEVVQWALEKLELSKYADKPAGTYSGGNKRKLSTAIALIGYPSLIFLDEPTTGMDPKARRFLWNLILDIIKTGRSVVLTSHSMEECEALCTRLGIMVNGRFKCLGSIQHLKNRFGDGYMITVRTKTTASVKEVIRFFNRNFPEAILKERHHTKIQYQLKSERISLAQVFSKMEQVVEVLSIEDYSVSQTTLDNVFVNFAKKQSDNLEQQESSPSNGGQSPLQRFLSILRPRPANTELSALVSEEPEELESDDDEGLISFEEERVQLSFNTDTLC
uniref:ATP-binding cassette, sub-family A (ABC1), member 2 n=1 Tax=Astyanax mexicanus TaxID=7994 RepID=A0A8B9GZR9_ASTMX